MPDAGTLRGKAGLGQETRPSPKTAARPSSVLPSPARSRDRATSSEGRSEQGRGPAATAGRGTLTATGRPHQAPAHTRPTRLLISAAPRRTDHVSC